MELGDALGTSLGLVDGLADGAAEGEADGDVVGLFVGGVVAQDSDSEQAMENSYAQVPTLFAGLQEAGTVTLSASCSIVVA